MGFKPEDYYRPSIGFVIHRNHVSTVDLQMYLGLGYTEAVKVMQLLEDDGIVGPHRKTKPRKVLI